MPSHFRVLLHLIILRLLEYVCWHHMSIDLQALPILFKFQPNQCLRYRCTHIRQQTNLTRSLFSGYLQMYILCSIFSCHFIYNTFWWLDFLLLCCLEGAGGNNCTNHLYNLLTKSCLTSKFLDWVIVWRQIHHLLIYSPTPL